LHLILPHNENKKSSEKVFCNYPDFQQYVATTPVPPSQTFHAPQFENSGSSPESNKIVVMKLHQNSIF